MARRRGGSIDISGTVYRRHSSNMRRRVKRVEQRLAKALEGIDDATEEALLVAAKSIMKRSNELAPKDRGWPDPDSLVNSSFVNSLGGLVHAKIGSDPVIVIGYRAEHAVYTHEIGPYANPTTPGTQYKYLETAMKERQGQIRSIVRRHIVRQQTGR